MRKWLIVLRLLDGSGFDAFFKEAKDMETAITLAVLDSMYEGKPGAAETIFLFDEQTGKFVLMAGRCVRTTI